MQARAYSYRIASVTSLSGFLFGFDIAIINGAIVFLRRQFHWTEIETEVAAGSLLAGCAAGAAIAGALSDRFGCAVKRRWSSVGGESHPGTGSLHPVAIGAVVEVTKLLKPLV